VLRALLGIRPFAKNFMLVKSSGHLRGDAGRLTTRYLLRRFWKGAANFWSSRGARWSWALSGILLLTIFLNLAASYGMNIWTRSVFDALQKREPDTVLFLSMLYLPLLAAGVFFGVVQVYARMSIQRRWRAWLNNELLDKLAQERPLLSARSCERRSPQPLMSSGR